MKGQILYAFTYRKFLELSHFIETERRVGGCQALGWEVGEDGELVFSGAEFQGEDEKVLVMDDGDGCPTV